MQPDEQVPPLSLVFRPMLDASSTSGVDHFPSAFRHAYRIFMTSGSVSCVATGPIFAVYRTRTVPFLSA